MLVQKLYEKFILHLPLFRLILFVLTPDQIGIPLKA